MADDLYATARNSECSQCGRRMDVVTKDRALRIVCPTNHNHEGYRKMRSLTQLAKEGYYIPYVSERVERRKQERLEEKMAGNERALALVQQQGIITREVAMEAIRTLWPKAGAPAVAKALMICVTHKLNPLDGEIFIISFKQKDKDGRPLPPVDTVVLGIPGVRKIARERSPYTYVDGPRVMPPQEQEDVLGEVYKDKVVVTVTLQTPKGGRFPGYGFWPRNAEVQGADKGNTKFNMASYRAERNALKRIVPDEDLPAPVGMVVQGVYADAPEEDAQAMLPAGDESVVESLVDAETGEVLEPEPVADVHFAQEITDLERLIKRAKIGDDALQEHLRTQFNGKEGILTLDAEERASLKSRLLDRIASLEEKAKAKAG